MKTLTYFRRWQVERAFTLIEVLIAVGLLAVSVVTILGMLPSLTKHGGEAITHLQAEQLPAGITSELRRLASTGFDGLASRVPVMNSPLSPGWPLVATRPGDQVMVLDSPPSLNADRVPEAEQYYLIECWRFPDEPLRYVADKDLLALHVRVSWPYHVPTGAGVMTTEPRERSELRFTVSITR